MPRPSLLNPGRQDKIVALIRGGASAEMAARSAGVLSALGGQTTS